MARRKALNWLVLLALMFFAVDTALYFALDYVNSTRNLFYDKTDLSRERIDAWLQNTYHPVLGWNIPKAQRNNLDTRRDQDYPAKEAYKIKAFGDSFTYGAEVDADQTYAAHIEQITGWDCLNYGVGAYGPDQALLKYRLTEVRSEYTILGILCENIGRLVSHNLALYMREWGPPKPRFVAENGTFALLENPIAEPEAAYRLLDDDFQASLKRHDYWPYFYEHKLQAPPRLQWPATLTVVKHLPFFYNRAVIEVQRRLKPTYEVEKLTYKYYHLYDDTTSEALSILKFVVDEFVAEAQARGEQPIVLVFSDQFSLDLRRNHGQNPYEPLISHLAQRGYIYIDLGAVFREEPYVEYFNFYNSHYSPLGNKRVAEEVIALIRELEAMKVPAAPDSSSRLSTTAAAQQR